MVIENCLFQQASDLCEHQERRRDRSGVPSVKLSKYNKLAVLSELVLDHFKVGTCLQRQFGSFPVSVYMCVCVCVYVCVCMHMCLFMCMYAFCISVDV